MALPIITALRQRSDLKESVLHTVQELAHRASLYGVVRVSYSYLAFKCHCSRRTVIRHIQRLIELKIIKKSVLWIKGNFCEINTYTFLLQWDKWMPAQGSDKTTRKFPRQEEGKKRGGLEEKIRLLDKGLRLLTPGSDAYQSSLAERERYRALLTESHGVKSPSSL